MTYGYGEPPAGWPPPSEPAPRSRGRRRAGADDDDDYFGRLRDDGDRPGGRHSAPPYDTGFYGRAPGPRQPAFEAPPPPPVAEPPAGYRPPASRAAGRATPPGTGGQVYGRASAGHAYGTAAVPSPATAEPYWDGSGDDVAGGRLASRRVSTGRAAVETRPAGTGHPGTAHGRLPQQTWLPILGGVVVVALLAICGVGGFLVIHGNGGGASAGIAANQAKHDITSQQTDAAPLSTAEVFPAGTIAPDPAGQPYPVVKTQLSNDCKAAAVGELAALLGNHGCTQVVRGTLISPDKAYIITAGLFNLRDQNGATQVSDGIKAVVDGQKGRFTGFDAGGPTTVITKVATQLGWDTQGHFLAYCVIARADGKTIDTNDRHTAKIINDMVEVYLKGTVIATRINGKPSSATTKPSATK